MNTSPTLINEIKEELREDLSRYDDEYDVWSEVVLDCPSNTLERLYGEIDPDDVEEVFETVIIPHIKSLDPDS